MSERVWLWESPIICPHCGHRHGNKEGMLPGCPDSDRWADAERDEFRDEVRRHYPAAQTAPSTEQMAARFGDRNRRDRERDA